METQLVAMDILVTVDLEHNGKEYTISLAQQRNDSTRHAFFIQNNATGKNAKYAFNDEKSQDFKFFKGESFFEYLPKKIKLDIESDII